MTTTAGFVHKIEWSNPYTNPPGNAPRVLAEVFTLESKAPEGFDNHRTLGGGYSLTICSVSIPTNRQLSQDALKSVRRKRLQRRIENKVPMFAEHFIEQEISKKPEYYNGITDPGLQQAKEDVLSEELERYQFYTQRINQVIVHGEEPTECKERAANLAAEMAAIRKQHQTTKGQNE